MTPTLKLTSVVPGITLIPAPATRQGVVLDLSLNNFADEVTNTSTIYPLTTTTGIESDHRILLVECHLAQSHVFEWVKYRTREITEEGKKRFLRFFRNIRWEQTLGGTIYPDESVLILHNKIENLNNMCFPWRNRKVKSTDHPWINDKIRRMIRRRNRRYRKHKRDAKWQKIKSKTDTEIANSKAEYYRKEVEKMKNGGLSFRSLQHLSDPDKQKTWNIKQMRPGKSDEEISEELAVFFTRITDEFTPPRLGSPAGNVLSPIQNVNTRSSHQKNKREQKTKLNGDW